MHKCIFSLKTKTKVPLYTLLSAQESTVHWSTLFSFDFVMSLPKHWTSSYEKGEKRWLWNKFCLFFLSHVLSRYRTTVSQGWTVVLITFWSQISVLIVTRYKQGQCSSTHTRAVCCLFIGFAFLLAMFSYFRSPRTLYHNHHADPRHLVLSAFFSLIYST